MVEGRSKASKLGFCGSITVRTHRLATYMSFRSQLHYFSSIPVLLYSCEALEAELQLSEPMLTIGCYCSIPSFPAAFEVVQKVWKQRLESVDYTIGWFNVANQDMCPIVVV